jgi:hypothetical protein
MYAAAGELRHAKPRWPIINFARDSTTHTQGVDGKTDEYLVERAATYLSPLTFIHPLFTMGFNLLVDEFLQFSFQK